MSAATTSQPASRFIRGDDDRRSVRAMVVGARKARAKYERFWRTFRHELTGIWRKSGSGNKRITNYPYLFLTTYLPELVTRTPPIEVETELEFTHEIFVEAQRLAVNLILEKQGLGRVLRRAAEHAFYGCGFVKTGLRADGSHRASPEAGTWLGDSGGHASTVPFIECISPFNMLWDEAAPNFEQSCILGHEFIRDRAAVEADLGVRYDPIDLEDVPNSEFLTDDYRAQKHEHLEDGEGMPAFLHLIELWVRPTNTLYTLCEKSADQFIVLRKTPFHGNARSGGYRKLGFLEVPEEVMDLSPMAASWDQMIEVELNERRANEQAQAEKRVVTAEEENAEAAARYKKAKPDDMVTGVMGVKEVSTGGVTAERLTYIQHAQGRLEMTTGVNDIRRGVGGGGGTATEASLKNQNTSARLSDMRRNVADFAAEVAQDVGFYVAEEPTIEVQGTIYSPEGLPAEVMVRGGPVLLSDLVGVPRDQAPPEMLVAVPNQPRHDAFAYSCDPDSLYRDLNAIRESEEMQRADWMLNSLRPALMSQGMDINLWAFVGDLARKLRTPNLLNWIVPMSPMAMAMMQSAGPQNPDGQMVTQMAGGGGTGQPGAGGGIQSQVMNSRDTGGAISRATTQSSPMRQAMTRPGSNNTPKGMP